MERNELLTKEILDYCSRIGIDIVGFADPLNFIHYKKNFQPVHYLKNVKTVIVIGIYLYDIMLDGWSQKNNLGYQFADEILQNFGHKIVEYISINKYKSRIVKYGAGLFLKDAGVLAGIGPIGKNNLLLTEKYGSQIRLRAIVTEAPLTCGIPIKTSKYCEKCNKCIDACPANALKGGKYNVDLCNTYQLAHLKHPSKYTSIWCNICTESCPVGKKN